MYAFRVPVRYTGLARRDAARSSWNGTIPTRGQPRSKPKPPFYLRGLAVRAAELVDNNRQAIDAVATVLLERGTLAGSEIDAILCNRVYVNSTPGRRN